MIDIQVIKNKILDLAMRGQLTEQLPEDGTAEELFQKIQVEKQTLIKTEKIKKDKLLPEIISDDVPFEIPDNWKWVKLGSIARILGGKRIPAGRSLTQEDTGHKYIRISDMKNRTVQTDGLLFVPEDIYPSISQYIINKEDIYITVAGTIGRVGKIPPEIDGANLTENADRIVFSHLDQDWLIICLSASATQKQIELLTTSVAQPKLAIKRIQEFIIPLPPLAEQQRIVDKIDQAFSVLDTIDELQAQYADNLTALKVKLIDAAIQGKLTEQLPEDGTAEELYQQIQDEKQALIKAGKIKKEKPLPEVTADEIPFEIPENWKWCRIGEIFTLQAGKNIATGSIQDHPDSDNRYPCYGGNGLRGYVNHFNVNGLHALIGRQGALCGNINFASGEFYATEHAVVVYEYSGTNMQWAGLTLRALNLNQYATSVAQPGLAVNKINKVLIPLPPLAEQKRIVQNIDELLPLFEK